MKKLIALVILCLTMTALMLPAYAAETVGSGIAGPQSTTTSTTTGSMYDPIDVDQAVGAPNVSTQQIVTHLKDKGNDVYSIVQTVGRWVCVVMFVIGLIGALVGCVFNKRMAAGCALGALISGVAYAGITCGKEIVQFIGVWARS